MNVLSHGIPFFCNEIPLRRYSGPHDLRYLGNWPGADFQYDPAREDAVAVIKRIGASWKPDLLLCWMPEVHPPPLHIEACPIPTVALVSDWNVFYPVLYENLGRYDAVLCDTPGVTALHSEWVHPHHVMPLYSHVSTIHRDHGVPRDIDVLFVGNLNQVAHAGRARYLERIAQLSGRYNILITTGVHDAAYGALLSRAKIVFNHSIRGELNLRVFETMACGALPLLEASNLEARQWFTPGEDIVLYDEHNLEALIEEHLHDWEGRGAAIAQRAHRRAASFAGENRFTGLIEAAVALPRSGRPFRDLPEDEQVYQTLLMYGFSRWRVYQQMEAGLLNKALAALPHDPRVWTAAGQHFANSYSEAASPAQRQERFQKAFLQAKRLAPDSAVCALNAASAFRACGREAEERQCLEDAIAVSGTTGWETVIGPQGNPFEVRWYRAAAEGRISPAMVHAEANIRLAVLDARNGRLADAERRLIAAHTLDPANVSGIVLYAEVLWAGDRRDDAIAHLSDHLDDLPMDLEARERLIVMLHEQGRTGEVQALAERALNITRACRTYDA